jgi:hypothetical protein
MLELKRIGRYIAVSGVFGVAVAGALVSGCGDDTGSTDGGPDTGAADQTQGDASQPDSSQPDSSQPDTSQSDTSRPDSTQPDGSQPDGTLQGDGAPNDARTDATGMDSPAPDANDAGGAETATGSDASEAGPSQCVTSVADLAGTDGGAPDGGLAPTLLYGFDSPDGGLDSHWQNFMDTGSTDSLSQTFTDGYPCAGALALSATYTAFGPKDQAYYNFTSAIGTQDWTGRTALHLWVKVVTTDFSTIAGIEVRVESNGYADKRYSPYITGTTLSAAGSHNGWHEIVMSLIPPDPDAASPDYVPASVNDFQVELQTQGTQVDGGPAGPPPATMLVDSIWLE